MRRTGLRRCRAAACLSHRNRNRLAQAAMKALVVHAPAALRLHLERYELAVLERRPPDRDRPSVQLAARADVR